MRMPDLRFPLSLALLGACTTDDAAPAGSDPTHDGTSGEAPSSTETETDGSTTDEPADEAAELELLRRLGGLWVAPVSSWTSVGDFPTMNMDMRPADDRVLFSRVDLDADNALRFAFSRETHDGSPVLVYRNGGLFAGLARDTRTRLVEHDPEAETWRFCAITGGCMYVDASFDFDGDDAFTLHVKVAGMDHMRWSPTRREERDLSSLDEALPSAAADVPFPEMPSARITLTWSTPLEEATEAWVILTTTDCGFAPGSCTPSRFMRTVAPEGATGAELLIEQIHAGSYKANAVLDHNGNLGATLFPDGGDSVSLPNQTLEIAPEGETEASFAITVDL
jgi:hypothetical protein